MRRRLTLAILGTVAAALLIAGVGTLLLARVGARQSSEEELRAQAESTASIVAFGQSRFGQLSSVDLDAMRASACQESAPGSTSTTLPANVEKLLTSLCEPSSEVALFNMNQELCADPNADKRLEPVMTDDMRKAKDAFCANPNPDNLDQVRVAYCAATDPKPGSSATPAARRRADQLRNSVCRAINVRAQSRQKLENTLSKESIDLVVYDRNNTMIQGDLPGGLRPEDVHPERLRNGDIVSNAVDNGFFAAAAVDPDSPNMSAIVIARPIDPVRGVVPWFLIASGVTMAIGVVVASSLSRRLTKPLREAQLVTAEIASGDLSVRLPEHSAGAGHPSDEIEELAHSINTMAEALERSRGLERQFLLSVSHDLRTPLTSIRGYAEAIADGAAPDPERAAGIILAESRRLERLVKDLLDLAKLDSRRFSLNVMAVELNEIAGDSVDGFRREVDALGLAIQLDPAPQPVVAFADPDRLQQVIANLVENAVKFARHTITVRVHHDEPVPGRPVARIEVIDDGPGIPDADLPHVFERLYVTTAVPERKETGSGLGLAIVREITEAMGGRVDAMANPPGQPGARMVVTLSTTPPAPPAGLPDEP